jgi:hypothetical protein
MTSAVPLEVQPRGVSFPTGAAVGRTDATVGAVATVVWVRVVAAPARDGSAPVSSATTPTTETIRRRARARRRVAGERVAKELVAGL